MNAAGTIVEVACGCIVVEHSEGWGSTTERCAAHGGLDFVACSDAGSRYLKRGIVHFTCRTCGRQTPAYRRWHCSGR